METKIRISRSVYLPPTLITKVNSLELTRIQRNKAFQLIDTIARRSRREYGIDTKFYPLPRNFLKNIFSSKYMDIVKPLRDVGIIQHNKFYDQANNVCYKYKVNPEYYMTENEYKRVVYEYKIPKIWKTKTEDTINDLKRNTALYHNHHIKTLEALKIDIKGLRDIVNNEIKTHDGDVKKVRSLKVHWSSSIDNIENKNAWYARRNLTNYRLDTNFTNMPSILKKKILSDNNMISLDLVSSQFSLLYTLMKPDEEKNESIKEFGNLVTNGKLYEYIARVKQITRSEAKNIMFEINFGRHYFKTINKELFAELFPHVNAWINEKKNNFGYKEVALMLQRFESKIFIDDIKAELMERDILHFTVHDSVCCLAKDKDLVKEIMLRNFRANGVEGNMKVEYTNELISI